MYLNEILALTTDDWTNKLTKLEQVLIKLQEKGLKCNIEKSSFAQSEMEYLGFWVTREGVRPIERNRRHSTYVSSNKYKGGSYMYWNDKLI